MQENTRTNAKSVQDLNEMLSTYAKENSQILSQVEKCKKKKVKFASMVKQANISMSDQVGIAHLLLS